MDKEYRSLDDLLKDCTVRVETKSGHGTAFFVAPGFVLTCAHVIEEVVKNKSSLAVHCNFNQRTIPVAGIAKEAVFSNLYPDLALLQVEVEDHPCVLLGEEYSILTDFYAYGYTIDHRDGESTTVKCEGTQEDQGTWIKLKEGQVKPGSSGSPLLNTKTHRVCGMMSRTRNRTSDLGGVAIPVTAIFAHFPDLEEQNVAFHKKDLRWSSLLERDKEHRRSNAVVALLYSKSKKIDRPRYFVGREDLLVEATSLLAQSCRVLLTGMAGIGKTAIARVLAEEYLQSEKGDVLWVEVRNEQPDAILEAMANCLGEAQPAQLKHLDEKIPAIKELLQKSHAGSIEKARVGLVVLENVHNVEAADKVTIAIPDEIPVLITSRQRYVVDQILEVNLLSASEALNVLEKTSGLGDLSNNADAIALCEQLGFHPYALELAGFMMREVNRTPRELRRRLADAPLDLSSSTKGRLRALLDDSAANLDAGTRAVLFAFGVFPSNGATRDLLAAYLNKEVGELQDSLDDLIRRHLIKRHRGTEFYFMHDLTFYYVRAQATPDTEEETQSLVDGVLRYLNNHRFDYDNVALDLPNFLLIAKSMQGVELVKIISYLTIGNYPTPEGTSYMDQRGYSLGLIEQLHRAIEESNDLGKEYRKVQPSLLSQYAVAMFDRGQYELALHSFERARKATTDRRRKVILGSAVARTMAFAGRYKEAKAMFNTLYKSAVQRKDQYLVAFVLEQKAWAAGENEDYETARRVSVELVKLNEKQYQIISNQENKEALFFSLLNLGSATLDLAKQKKAKFDDAYLFHKRAWELIKDQPGSRLEAQVMKALGEDCALLGKGEEALSYLKKAFFLFGDLGITEKQKEIIAMFEDFKFLSDLPSLRRSLK